MLKYLGTLDTTCDIEEIAEDAAYEYFSLGIYDHWLSEDEARDEILSYSMTQDGDKKLSEYLTKEQEFIDFLIICFKNHRVLCFDCDQHYIFENEQEFEQLVRKMLREESRPIIHIVDLDIVIYGGFDLNCEVFSKNHKSIESIRSYLVSYPSLFLLKG